MAGNPRNGRPYRRLVDWLRAQHLPCWLCGHEIGYGLDARHPLSFTLDHLVPLSRGGDLLDRANARPAHRRCNSRRGARVTEITKPQPRASRRW
ncbi:HNH endonuclease [Streptomyces sp. AVP053U2]|uniref:HNH endonuclease n=1 Tax=Streptomyces sp. AVP053U2 TaxID=1737066 RepID=UPI00073B2CDF|nr:HNH endonuclease [Streptomyces sp. AVP053U2]ODA69527.1 HNH endonuclease [Streptomyces sp. AVP053U2]